MGSPFERVVTPDKIAAVFWSHAIIIIGIIYAYRSRLWIVMSTAICVGIMSTTYHMVQLRMFGMEDISLFWVGDYSTNYNMVLAIEMWIYDIDPIIQAAILSFTPIVLVFLGTMLHQTIVMWVILLLYFIAFSFIHVMYMLRVHKTIWVINTRTVLFLIFLIIYTAGGIFFLYWAGNPGDRYYFWPHVGAWHPIIFTAFDMLMMFVFYCGLYKTPAPAADCTPPIVDVESSVVNPSIPSTMTHRNVMSSSSTPIVLPLPTSNPPINPYGI
jgi:hypothetical protein